LPVAGSNTSQAPTVIAGTTNSSVSVAPAQPLPPRLQGIVFDPRRPSAVINGKTLFVGERFGSLRVSAIAPDRVILIGGGTTNVLTLEQ
jgi:hypothetical protein